MMRMSDAFSDVAAHVDDDGFYHVYRHDCRLVMTGPGTATVFDVLQVEAGSRVIYRRSVACDVFSSVGMVR